MRCVFSLVCLLGFLGAAVEVHGDELKSPQGFTITYPEGWQPASKAELEHHAETIAGLAALIHGPLRAGAAQHVIVIVKPMPPEYAALSTAAKLQAIESVTAGSQRIPRGATNVKKQRKEVGGTTAVTLSYELNSPQLTSPLRTCEFFLPGKEKIYVFRCSAVKPQWDTAWPIFKQMIDSVHIDVADSPKNKP
jgi:hypothetical protein